MQGLAAAGVELGPGAGAGADEVVLPPSEGVAVAAALDPDPVVAAGGWPCVAVDVEGVYFGGSRCVVLLPWGP